MQHFDYRPAAQQANLSAVDLARLEALVRADYPQDDMLFELHVLRVCIALRDGRVRLAQVFDAKEPRRLSRPRTGASRRKAT
jgi:hypothetical protein